VGDRQRRDRMTDLTLYALWAYVTAQTDKRKKKGKRK
jgi:hypothetical protein